jgi:hypothetical protein
VPHFSKSVVPFAFLLLLAGCEEEAAKTPPAKASAVPAPTPTPPPAPSVAPAPPKLRDDCPKGSSGVGTMSEPCLASGDARMMEVKYTGKTTDEGPKFQIINKADQQVLFGSLAVYFYDKAGKQLEVKSGDKAKPFQPCAGNIFAGAVKPGEKIFMFFSCVKKEHVPEGTVTIEAEAKTVGFADEEGKKNEFYWSNPDLAPNERAKGGAKAKPKK